MKKISDFMKKLIGLDSNEAAIGLSGLSGTKESSSNLFKTPVRVQKEPTLTDLLRKSV